MTKANVIWEATLDGRYQCKVVRLSHRSGRLTVQESGRELLRTIVSLAYGAEYGPDAADIASWERSAEAAITRGHTQPVLDACDTCGVRSGLGPCGTCILRSIRGIDGVEDWTRTIIRLVESIPDSTLTVDQVDQKAKVLGWARGEDVQFED